MPTLVEIGPSNASQGQHRREEAYAGSWVRLLASVNFFNYFVASFLLCCPCEALEGPISTRVGIILTTTLIQSRHIIIRIALLYIYIYIYIYIYSICIYLYMCIVMYSQYMCVCMWTQVYENAHWCTTISSLLSRLLS